MQATSPRRGLPLPPPIAAVFSIVPGLGQILVGRVSRGLSLLVFILSLYGLAAWRISDAAVDLSLLPPSIDLDGLNNRQTEAVTYGLVVFILTALVHIWNLYDAFSCAEGKPAPARLPGAFLLLASLIVGAHITQLDIGKAVREIDDVRPRLLQMLWPWDDIWERQLESFQAKASWETPCDDTPPEASPAGDGGATLTVEPDCGELSGLRQPNGTRQEGTLVTVHGTGFRPNEEAKVFIDPPSIPEFQPRFDGDALTVTPDGNGEFDLSFVMPNVSIPTTAVGAITMDIIVRQEEEVGTLRPNENFSLALEGIIETIFLAFMATAAGTIMAVPISFLAARNLMVNNSATYFVYYVVRLILNVIRSIEPIIWALIAIIWVGPGPFAGVLALMIHTVASLGKLYSEAIETIDTGPMEAIEATGADRLQTIMYAVVPQVVPPFVSFTIYRWDINVRMSTIIGAVGGGGIGFILVQWIRLADYNSVGIAVWMIAIVVTILDYASARIRERYI